MAKKYIFIDLDGTIIDHENNKVPESTFEAIKKAKENGHEIIISTGRPPSLFYGIHEKLGVNSYIASNGRLVVYNDELIYKKPIDKEVVKGITDLAYRNKIDIAFESLDEYVINSKFSDIYLKFSEAFHIHVPELRPNYHLDHDIYQMVLFYTEPDFKKFELDFPTLSFHYSNQYGLDINEKGGLKDIGVKKLQEFLSIPQEDIIAIGDGFNDISMIEYANIGIAMGNAYQPLKDKADYITESVSNDGVYKAFKNFNLI